MTNEPIVESLEVTYHCELIGGSQCGCRFTFHNHGPPEQMTFDRTSITKENGRIIFREEKYELLKQHSWTAWDKEDHIAADEQGIPPSKRSSAKWVDWHEMHPRVAAFQAILPRPYSEFVELFGGDHMHRASKNDVLIRVRNVYHLSTLQEAV